MSKHNIGDLRGHLFDAIEQLKSGAMDVKTAQAVAQLGDVVVQSAKVEVEFMKLAGNTRSAFIGDASTTRQELPPARPDKELQPESIDARYGKVGDKYYGRVEDPRGEAKLVEIPWRSLKETLGGLECVPIYADHQELEAHLVPIPQ